MPGSSAAGKGGPSGPRTPAGASTGGRREEIDKREYDPRREERRKATRLALPEDADPRLLDEDIRRELRSLSRETAELVSKHLVVAGQLVDDEPERALAHARAARALAGRVGVVRQAAGVAAYAAQEWTEALSELRAARRITGRPEHLAVMADCERALGRPERALAYGDDPVVSSLSQDDRVELVIVLAGARRDMGQLDAAVLALQTPARATTAKRPWAARLWYAFADALLAAGRESEAREWFGRAADLDTEGQTDAADRVLELDGVLLEDLVGDEDGDPATGTETDMDDAALAAYVAAGFTESAPAYPRLDGAEVGPGRAAEVGPGVGRRAGGDGLPGPVPSSPSEGPAGAKSPLAHPFSADEPGVEPARAARPAAALTPAFAAPQEADDDDKDNGDLTLFS